MRALALGLLLASAPAAAQRLPYADMLGMPDGLAYGEVEVAREGTGGGVADFYGDRFEVQAGPGGDGYSWDVSAEIGSAEHRLWLALAGDGLFEGGVQYVEGQALYSHPILAEGLALQVGVRRDFVRPRRSYAVLGVQGSVGDPLYVGLFGYLSTRNELSFRAFAYYDWELAGPLVLQPYAAAEAITRDAPALGLGRGATELELGLRMRYQLADRFGPYLGVRWDRLLGRTARIARQAGDDPDTVSLVAGLRSYF